MIIKQVFNSYILRIKYFINKHARRTAEAASL